MSLDLAHSINWGYPRSNLNLEVLAFEERGKLEYPEKNLSEQGREPTTLLNPHSTPRVRESNPGHIGGRPAWEANDQPLRHPCNVVFLLKTEIFKGIREKNKEH